MYKQLIISIAFIFIGLHVFSQSGNSRENEKHMNKTAPQGTVWIKGNLYMDRTEIRNIDYREYLYWIIRNYGRQNEMYNKALPDTMVWMSKLGYYEPYVIHYFRHPAFNNFPVVGITAGQAIDYCAWRTKRVKEYYLLKKKLITQEMLQDLSKREFIDSLICVNDIKLFFRLPSQEEWEYAARANNEDAIFPWDGKSMFDRNGVPRAHTMNCLFGFGQAGFLNDNTEITCYVEAYQPNDFGLYCMAGNVAEIVYGENWDEHTNSYQDFVLKGGSWKQPNFQCMIDFYDSYFFAADFVGFRCVCIME